MSSRRGGLFLLHGVENFPSRIDRALAESGSLLGGGGCPELGPGVTMELVKDGEAVHQISGS